MCFSTLPRSSTSVFSSVVHLRGVSGFERMLATISPRLLEDRVAVQVVEVPAGGAGLLGELAHLFVEGGQRVAEEDAARALRRPLAAAEGRRREALQAASSVGSAWSSAWYSRCMSSTAVLVPS